MGDFALSLFAVVVVAVLASAVGGGGGWLQRAVASYIGNKENSNFSPMK